MNCLFFILVKNRFVHGNIKKKPPEHLLNKLLFVYLFFFFRIAFETDKGNGFIVIGYFTRLKPILMKLIIFFTFCVFFSFLWQMKTATKKSILNENSTEIICICYRTNKSNEPCIPMKTTKLNMKLIFNFSFVHISSLLSQFGGDCCRSIIQISNETRTR